jgi:hypothetical protein
MICNEALYHIPKGFHKLLISRVKPHTLVKGICGFFKPLQVKDNQEMLDNVNHRNTHGTKGKEGMPATSGELSLPDTKLLTNPVLALYRPLHQLMLGQVAPSASSSGFYSKAR